MDKLITKVDNHIKEMYRFNDPSIKNILLEVNASNLPLNVKADLAGKLSRVSDKLRGRFNPNPTSLMRAPLASMKRRNVSYRAKYKGNFDGGAAGTSRTTKQ